MVHAQASLGFCDEGVSVLEECGGHANPYHYHERMTCLYTTDEPSGHSTTTATMLDGKMLYGTQGLAELAKECKNCPNVDMDELIKLVGSTVQR